MQTEDYVKDKGEKGERIIINIKQVLYKYQEAMTLILHKSQNIYTNPLLSNALEKNQELFNKVLTGVTTQPETLVKIYNEYSNRTLELICNTVERFYGYKTDPLYKPDKKDKRFKDECWKENIFFDFIKQMYIMSGNWWQQNIKLLNLSDNDTKYLSFISRQLIDALSPSNFLAYNPIVIKETLDSDYANIVAGLDNLLNDLKTSNDILAVKTSNPETFVLGENIATTKGKVLVQNDLMQLICYEPRSRTYEIPILISPPWINKYYILDLVEENSFIKWLVENGFQVFVISWVNPNEEHANKSFEHYMQEGILFALDYITKRFNYRKVNIIGYCIGGTLLATTLAYLAAKGKDTLINSATFLTTLLDFSDTGDLALFIDEATIKTLEKTIKDHGYFDSKYMSSTFSMLRANDMIWSFVINNYLLGRQPVPVDLLYWNSDATNLSAAMLSFYINNMYLRNMLKEPGRISMLGTPIDLNLVKVPSFFLATKEDHIVPWTTSYKGAALFRGPVEFCLAGSGHVAGVINPPIRNKYSYHVNKNHYTENVEDWLNGSEEKQGSWWVHWHNWVTQYSGDLKKAIDYKGIRDYIELAPGSYVKVKI